MDCCEGTSCQSSGGAQGLDRRTVLRGMLGVAGGALVASGGLAAAEAAPAKKIRLAFCSQLLCIVPYEVARAEGHFKAEGLDVELVYTRGGGAAMQALVGGAVDYAATAFDVALQAYARGAKIVRFASTGRLPLFALATAPARAKEIQGVKDLENRLVGISALGNADHILVLYLMKQAGADAKKVRFAILGPNLFDALRLGQVDAGMVQEPALSLLTEAGSRVIVNTMDIGDANKYLGGPYEFMGVAVRSAERDQRLDEMRRLARALGKALRATRTEPVEKLIGALPKAMVAGGNTQRLAAALGRYRKSLYPDNARIDLAASLRVANSHREAGLLKPEVKAEGVLDLKVLGG
ncbi:MAG: taurine ABC transporter substrate-binding protein [Candidatus Tectomicrobia bacterium RIFCSPLOWO2_12_FULL_69_37]|nr:MAG: taurine ABC transporter substrate-binding protein [Candidatus Tectomicrobia bacterium RIFCSPLOWO2_12_FULL_69_37]OGL64796.1 MAG: taurine ABC transporter substrate-binding protein [Candidatus Tectomicrobia bacterium RIFCSPLOWO2_02_FULL_70_19]